ncbi:uncharacterized protein LOC141857874 [Brevipalpus obovatus]|uniref:uncharacterized protein LOC141857874 n=1 Tax=Brevipalpus obovatus TaxID=246614 RepID=UPI003D9F520F
MDSHPTYGDIPSQTSSSPPTSSQQQSLSQPCLPPFDPGATRILPFLYLGSQKDAFNKDLLKALNITYELNVSTTCPKPDHVQESHFLRIPVNDSYTERLLPYFPIAFDFLERVRKSEECALVHCLAGISRSATIVIAYLMKHSRLTLDDAYRYVKSKRATISPNFHFLGQLLEYEEILKREWMSEPIKMDTTLLSPLPRKQVTSIGQKRFCSSLTMPSSSSCSALSSLASPSSRFSLFPSSSPSPSSSGRNFTLKIPTKSQRIVEVTDDHRNPADQSPTATLAKLSFSTPSSSQPISSFETRDRLKQRPIEEIISSCPRAGRRFVSEYCSSLTVRVGDSTPAVTTTTVTRTVEKRRADCSTSTISFDLPLRSHTDFSSSSYESGSDLPTQAKTSRIEKTIQVPISLISSKDEHSSEKSSSHIEASMNRDEELRRSRIPLSLTSSETFKLGSLQMPWRKKDSKTKSTTKWYVGLDREDISKENSQPPILEGVERTESDSSDLCQRSARASSSTLASEMSDTSTDCSSVAGDRDFEPVVLRRGIIDRKYNPSVASQDSAYVSMIMDSSRGTLFHSFDSINPEIDDEKMVTSPDNCDINEMRREASGTEVYQKNLTELESSHDSGIQGSMSSWTSSFTSSIMASSSMSSSSCRDSEAKVMEKSYELEKADNIPPGDSKMDRRGLYRVSSYPGTEAEPLSSSSITKSGGSGDKEEWKDDESTARHVSPSSEGSPVKSLNTVELRSLGSTKWCNCSCAQRNRYSLDITCLFPVQSTESALKDSCISYESCPDILSSNSHYYLSRSRSICARCSRLRRGSYEGRRPSSVSGRLHRSERSSPESPKSLFTNHKLISVS